MNRLIKTGGLAWIFLLIGTLPAGAGSVEVTPFYGYGFGGELVNFYTGDRVNLRSSGLFGMSLDVAVDPNDDAWIEIWWSHQENELQASFLEPARLDFDLDYYHIGGVYEFESDHQAVVPFVVGSVGATHFSPEQGDFSSDTRLSMGLGGGVKLMPAKRVGFRLEARFLGSYFGSHATLVCGSPGGCAVGVSGDLLWQVHVSAGLVIRLGS